MQLPDSLGMNLTYQPTLPFTLSFTKPFAWPRSSYGDFLGEGDKGIPPAPKASCWCLVEWMYSWAWDHKKNIKPFIWPLAEPHRLPFQLCFRPPKTTYLSSRRAWTGLGFTKGRLGLVPQFVGFGFVFPEQSVDLSVGFYIAMLLHSGCHEHGYSEGWDYIFFPLRNLSFVSSSCQVCEHYLRPESQTLLF